MRAAREVGHAVAGVAAGDAPAREHPGGDGTAASRDSDDSRAAHPSGRYGPCGDGGET